MAKKKTGSGGSASKKKESTASGKGGSRSGKIDANKKVGSKCQTSKKDEKASDGSKSASYSTKTVIKDGRKMIIPLDEKGHVSDEYLASHFSDCGSGRGPGRRCEPTHRDRDPYDTYLVVDEFGDVSPYRPEEASFGYTTTITKDPKRMQKIAQENRRLHGTDEEVKASEDTWAHRLRMVTEIKRSDMKSETYYVDKRSPPKGWERVDRRDNDSEKSHSRRKNEVRRDLLEDAIEKSVKPLDGEIMVVIDEHTSYKDVKPIGKKLSNRDRHVTTEKYRSQDKGEYPDMLQTNDYITYEAGEAARGEPLHALLMGIRMRRYKITDDITRKK